MNKKRFKLPTNLLINNLLLANSDERSAIDIERARTSKNKTYFELQVVDDEDGFHEELVEVDYPITPDYVKSFESSTDYHTDLDGAMNTAQRANLGNIVDMQEVLKMDSSAISQLAESLKKVETQKAVEEKQSEVSANE